MSGWQAIYDELSGKGFEILAAAQDTGGEETAGPYYDAARATFACLIDAGHEVSALYHLVNVPTGVWIDEEGRIVRPGEVAFSRDFSFLEELVPGDRYVAALRDWVERGAQSPFAMEAAKIAPRSPEEQRAEEEFRLGLRFHAEGDDGLAERHWLRAQELDPKSWSYHRQAWVFTGGAREKWMEKYRSLGGEPYYGPPAFPDS